MLRKQGSRFRGKPCQNPTETCGCKIFKNKQSQPFGDGMFYKRVIFQHVWEDISDRVFENKTSTAYLCRNEQHLTNLCSILLESLLAQRFDAACWALYGLCGRRTQVPELMWRAGLEVIKSYSKSQNNTILYYKKMFPLCTPYKVEFLLDFAFHLISSQEDILEGYELLKTRLSGKALTNNLWLRAQLGMLENVKWKTMQLRDVTVQEEALEEEPVDKKKKKKKDKTASQGYHATTASWCFEGLEERDGTWDNLMIKHVQLLIHQNKMNEAIQILQRYRDKNPGNPNAHRYLYYCLIHSGADHPTLRAALEKLVHCDPTTEHLAEFLQENKQCEMEAHESVEIKALFEKLDHAAWSQDEDLWKRLNYTIKHIKMGCGDEIARPELARTTLEDCWDMRSDWWPQYHFNPQTVTQSDRSILEHKNSVARLLLGEDHPFTKRSRERITPVGQKRRHTEDLNDNSEPKKQRERTESDAQDMEGSSDSQEC